MRRLTCALLIAALTTSLSACSAPGEHCAVGHEPTFALTVRYASTDEPAVRFCDAQQCSPVPPNGLVPDQLIDRSQAAPALLIHSGRGEWQIHPRGEASTSTAAPTSARIELYTHGKKTSTTTIRLNWPSVDPCATTEPALPHPTVTSP